MEPTSETTAKRDEYLESEWSDDFEESDEFFDKNIHSRRLVSGINLKDLCDGKEVIFEISTDINDGTDSDSDTFEDISHYDLEKVKNKKGAAILNQNFKEIADAMTNVTEDGLVKKQIIVSGAGKIVPEYAYVTVHYNLYKEDCEEPFDSTYFRKCPEKFRLDQGETILGLEYAIKSMKKHENSLFFIKWEVAFGALGCPDRIGKKCDIVANITLLNFLEIDPEYDLKSNNGLEKFDFTKILNQTKRLLCNGGDSFLKGDFKPAIICYKKSLKILNSMRLANEDEESEMLKQKTKCLVNLAVCYNKLGKPELACKACQEVLSIDHNHVKANFHYGRASITLSNFAVAKECLLRAAKLKPDDLDISKEIKRLYEKEALYEMKDKMFWKKAIDGEIEKKEKVEVKLSPLEFFEKNLKTKLEECLKKNQPHILSTPVPDENLKVCEKVADEMNLEFEKVRHSLVEFYKSKRVQNLVECVL